MPDKNKAKRMTVSDMLSALETLPKDTEIVMASDPEGNDYYYMWKTSLAKGEYGELIMFPVERAEGVV